MENKPITVGELRLPYDDQIVKIHNCSVCGKFMSLMNFDGDGEYPHRDAIFNFDDTPHVSIYCSHRCAYGEEKSEIE